MAHPQHTDRPTAPQEIPVIALDKEIAAILLDEEIELGNRPLDKLGLELLESTLARHVERAHWRTAVSTRMLRNLVIELMTRRQIAGMREAGPPRAVHPPYDESKRTRYFNILIEPTERVWVARCIEHDLVTQADTRPELDREIALMFAAHEAACRDIGVPPYYMALAPVDVRRRFDAATSTPTSASVFTAAGWHLRLTMREAA